MLVQRTQTGLAATAFLLAFVFGVYGLTAQNPGYIYCAVAILMFVLPALIGLSRKTGFDIFEPINVAAMAILFGTTLRGFYLVFGADRGQAKFLMMRQDFAGINERIWLVLLGVVLFCVGYMSKLPRFRLERWPLVRDFNYSKSRLGFSVTVSLALATVGLIAFFITFNVDFSGGLAAASQKRVAEYIGSSGEIVYGAGWQTILSQVTQYTFVIYLACIFARKLPASPFHISITIGLFAYSTIVPFLTSNRTPIILLLFAACALGYYYQRLRLRTVVVSLVAVTFIVAAMGAIRATNQGLTQNSDVLDLTIGSGNGFDAVRAAAVIDRIPAKHDYLMGSSYVAIPFFWVPRAVWPDKPTVGLGAFVKRDLFNEKWTTNNGWPPSIVGEAWINFGMLGIISILPLAGVGFRLLYESCRPLLGKSIPVTAIYSVVCYRLGWNCVELDLSIGLVSTFASVAPLILFLWLAKGRPPRRNSPQVNQVNQVTARPSRPQESFRQTPRSTQWLVK